MSAEIRDKRNNELVSVGMLQPADHFMLGNSVYVYQESAGVDICAVNIATGRPVMFKPSDPVQQVHIVIEAHLV